jgi:hypothetical protein
LATTRLTVVGNEIEADLACSLLRSEGIECFSKRTDLSAGMGDASSTIAGPFEIWVEEEDVERATELLAG